MLLKAQTEVILDNTFYMDDQVKFSNPVPYVLNPDSTVSFLVMYCVFVCTFFGMIGLIMIFSNKLFKQQQQSAASDSNMSETKYFTIKIMSTLVTLFLTFLQIPFLMLLFQGFICGEDATTVEYSLPSITCGSTDSQALRAGSGITLVVFLTFSLLELTIYTQTKVDSKIPWSKVQQSSNYLISTARMTIKVILVASFIFDKQGESKPQYLLPCFVILLYLLSKSFTDSMYFMRRIQIASSFYDIFIATHLFLISIHILTSQRQSVLTTFIFMLNSLLFAALYNYLQESMRFSVLENGSQLIHSESVSASLVYFSRLQQLIDSNCREGNLVV